jgi:hypothetical protein
MKRPLYDITDEDIKRTYLEQLKEIGDWLEDAVLDDSTQEEVLACIERFIWEVHSISDRADNDLPTG